MLSFLSDRTCTERLKTNRFAKRGHTIQLRLGARLCRIHGRRMGNVLRMALLRTGFVLVLARVSLSPCAFLVTDFLFLSALVNRFRISRALVTLNRSPIGDTKRSLRSADQTDLGQVSKSVCSRPYPTSQVSLSISVCDILTHAYIEFVLSELLLCLSVLTEINQHNGKIFPDRYRWDFYG